MTTLSLRTLTRTLWLRQQLVPGQRAVSGVPEVVGHVLGLQAQDNLPPYLSLAARIDGFSPADLSDRIEDRTLVRFFTMRGTVHVHVTCTDDGPAGCSQLSVRFASSLTDKCSVGLPSGTSVAST